MSSFPIEAEALSDEDDEDLGHQSRQPSESDSSENPPMARLDTIDPVKLNRSACCSIGNHQAVYLKEVLASKQAAIVGIFVGHGQFGMEIATFAKESFEQTLRQHVGRYAPDAALPQCFNRVQTQIASKFPKKALDSGTTATVLWLGKDQNYCANVGDSCAMIIKTTPNRKKGETPRLNGRGELLTEEHTMWNESERRRIETNQGVDIVAHRCKGVELGKPLIFDVQRKISSVLSRSLGDLALKEHGVLVMPHVKKFHWSDDDSMLLIGTGAFWDIADHRSAAQLCADLMATYQDNAFAIAERLMDRLRQARLTNEAFSFFLLLFNRTTQKIKRTKKSSTCTLN